MPRLCCIPPTKPCGRQAKCKPLPGKCFWTIALSLIKRENRDTSNPPVNITNTVGSILLRKGYTTLPRTFDLHSIFFVLRVCILSSTGVLAEGFDILSGSQEITVPGVDTGYDYRIVRTYIYYLNSARHLPTFYLQSSAIRATSRPSLPSRTIIIW